MGFGSPPPPSLKMPPPSAHPSTLASNSVALAGRNAAIAGAAANGKGKNNTVQTSPQGDMSITPKAKTTLLGE